MNAVPRIVVGVDGFESSKASHDRRRRDTSPGCGQRAGVRDAALTGQGTA